jgi:hypothetical protein
MCDQSAPFFPEKAELCLDWTLPLKYHLRIENKSLLESRNKIPKVHFTGIMTCHFLISSDVHTCIVYVTVGQMALNIIHMRLDEIG